MLSELVVDGSGYDVLHSFGSTGDGLFPVGLIQATDGNLYGTTFTGGSALSRGGIVFRIAPDGSDYAILSRQARARSLLPQDTSETVIPQVRCHRESVQ